MKKEHPALELLTTLIEDAKATPMNTKKRELREILEEKLYNNFYNPKNKVTQTTTELPDFDNEIKSLNFTH